MDDKELANNIPFDKFKSNKDKNERFIQLSGQMSPTGQRALEAPLSPGAKFCMRDQSFKQAIKASNNSGANNDQLSPRSDGGQITHCVCGLPMRPEQDTCD